MSDSPDRMQVASKMAIAAALGMIAAPALSEPASPHTRELPPYLECVPYARAVSGIQIFGDAYTWWDQAAGRYRRGHTPRAGAVMAFERHGNMRLGHVAAVSKVVDSRTVLLRHANWSPLDGRGGQVENDVRAVDVSAAGDWSAVRVWNAAIGDLGTTAWPVAGFIYPGTAAPELAEPVQLATAPKPKSLAPPRDFLAAFAEFAQTDDRKRTAPPESARRATARARPVDLLAQLGG
ncbi:CHAP domain-containing protein [Croceibacterium aestuarii]|uniref:CHAP domain-containing protein n=1 Tax=Croceibacterium aestuarii TaxID=3064139 RepID=UPI00272EE855|nr:CHAP domain-containing protein [Croceibacterium sp. D39]